MSESRLTWQCGEDRTLYLTISLYVDRDRIPEAIAHALDPAYGKGLLARYLRTSDLREAMDPLFNDIANRERLGKVDDYLLDVPGPPEGEEVELLTPRMIRWTTEGTTYEIDLEKDGVHDVRARRFWYVHLNRAMSYHVSLSIRYDDTAADLFALSLLQKALAPKEFRNSGTAPAPDPTGGSTGILPLDKVEIREPGHGAYPLWRWIESRFERDANDLFTYLCSGTQTPAIKAEFDQLVARDPFLEIPGLLMPRARFMFFFQDRTFFDTLLPRSRPNASGDPVRVRRMDLVRTDDFLAYPAMIQERRERARSAGDATVSIPLSAIAAIDPEHLRYLFLAGFTQNIIDFINQDASEVLDSLDPIYPTTAEQEEESFFVRFANPRALMTFVARSRSLETGNDWIGTCPYAFLIHAFAMHNEFFVRKYQKHANTLLDDVRRDDEAGRLRQATEQFYAFRLTQFGEYQRHRYVNVFRYDTEKDVFAAVEARRGIERNVVSIETLIDDVEKQTQDREARLAKRSDDRLTLLLAFIAIMTFGFELVSKLKDLESVHAIRFGGRFGLEILAPAGLDLAILIMMALGLVTMLVGVVLWRKKII
ncbi:MAG: hypothetical protein R3D98_05095 [Candidatus Krumholzibacteriia bacterium]